MKPHLLLALCLASTLHASDPAWLSTGDFQWQSTPPLIGPATAQPTRRDAEGYKAKKYGSIPWQIGMLDLQTKH